VYRRMTPENRKPSLFSTGACLSSSVARAGPGREGNPKSSASSPLSLVFLLYSPDGRGQKRGKVPYDQFLLVLSLTNSLFPLPSCLYQLRRSREGPGYEEVFFNLFPSLHGPPFRSAAGGGPACWSVGDPCTSFPNPRGFFSYIPR